MLKSEIIKMLDNVIGDFEVNFYDANDGAFDNFECLIYDRYNNRYALTNKLIEESSEETEEGFVKID